MLEDFFGLGSNRLMDVSNYASTPAVVCTLPKTNVSVCSVANIVGNLSFCVKDVAIEM